MQALLPVWIIGAFLFVTIVDLIRTPKPRSRIGI